MRRADLNKVSDFCACADLSNQRLEAIGALDLNGDRSLLDVGCGLGHLCRDARRAMGPKGCVVGIDKDSDNVAFASSLGHGDCRYIRADALSLPFRSCSFDYVACVQVAEYIADTSALLRNMRRVLRGGGKALIVNTDWSTMSWPTADRSLTDAVSALWSKHCYHDRLHETLPSELEGAGFHTKSAWVYTIENTRFDKSQYSGGLALMIGAFASFVGSQRERHLVDSWRAHLRELHERGEYVFRLERRFVLATKP